MLQRYLGENPMTAKELKDFDYARREMIIESLQDMLGQLTEFIGSQKPGERQHWLFLRAMSTRAYIRGILLEYLGCPPARKTLCRLPKLISPEEIERKLKKMETPQEIIEQIEHEEWENTLKNNIRL